MIGHQARRHNKKYTYWISEPDSEEHRARTPILLIHGFGGTFSGLEELSDLLSTDTTIVGLDLPGYGVSEPLRARHTLANYARFLNEFCKETQFHKLNIVGHSFGADISIVFAAMFPHRVEKLTLLSPVIMTDRRKANAGKYYYDFVARMPKRLRHTMLHSHTLTRISDYYMFRQASDRRRAKILRDDYISDHLMSDRPVIESYRSIHTTNFLRLASRIHAPTQIIAGANDPLSPVKDMQALHKELQGSKLEIVQDAGHFLPLEDPRTIAKFIRKFHTTK